MQLKRIATHEQVCAVIVIHYPQTSFVDRVEHLLTQVGGVIVINNGCDKDIQTQFEDTCAQHAERLFWIDNDANNLAHAQNLGIEEARKQQFGFVLLLDDDSEPAEDMVAQMLKAYNVAPQKDSIGLIAPHMIDANSKRETRYLVPFLGVGFRRLSANSYEIIEHVQHVIASGSLIPISVINAIGHMDDSYVIDYIDKEYGLRLNRNGYRIMVVTAAQLNHSIGKCEDHQIFGKRITTTNHSPARRYYIYRNRLRTMARYAFSMPSFVIYEMLGILYDLFRITMHESNRKAKWVAIIQGIWDACMGVSGEAPKRFALDTPKKSPQLNG